MPPSRGALIKGTVIEGTVKIGITRASKEQKLSNNNNNDNDSIHHCRYSIVSFLCVFFYISYSLHATISYKARLKTMAEGERTLMPDLYTSVVSIQLKITIQMNERTS